MLSSAWAERGVFGASVVARRPVVPAAATRHQRDRDRDRDDRARRRQSVAVEAASGRRRRRRRDAPALDRRR